MHWVFQSAIGGDCGQLLQKHQWLFIVVFAVLLPVGYKYQDRWYEVLLRFLLLSVIFMGFSVRNVKRLPIISYLGTETFPIYLWHVAGKLIGEALVGNTWLYYLISAIWVIVLVLILRITVKIGI